MSTFYAAKARLRGKNVESLNDIRTRLHKDISYDYGNGRVHIKKGVLVTVPVYALHHLEEYYPDHETFDPER